MSFSIKAAASPLAASIVLFVFAGFPLIPAKAAEAATFTIPSEEGYGIADCMRPGNACGLAMANSFCEAHGRQRAAAYGSADDITGSIPAGAPNDRPAATDVIIRCTD